jgi:hypothetical protein
MGFGSLQPIRTWRSTRCDRCRRPLRSARRVWLPSRRLTPSEPVPVLFHTGGALGIQPFGAFSSQKVSAAFPGGSTHIPFHPSVFPVVSDDWAGPMGRGFWAFTLSRVPGGRRGISPPNAGCSHGLRPSRVCRRGPGPGFRPNSSHALRRSRSREQRRPAPRSITQLSLGPARQTGKPA